MPNDVQVSLSDIAGVNMIEVDELRFENLPKMSGKFKVKEAKIEAIGKDAKPAIIVIAQPLEIVQVISDEYKTPEEQMKLLDKEHREGFFVKEAKDLGRFKAFVVDAGVKLPEKGSGQIVTVEQLCALITGMEFPGKIEHRNDTKDPSIVRANLRPIVTKPGQAA